MQTGSIVIGEQTFRMSVPSMVEYSVAGGERKFWHWSRRSKRGAAREAKELKEVLLRRLNHRKSVNRIAEEDLRMFVDGVCVFEPRARKTKKRAAGGRPGATCAAPGPAAQQSFFNWG